VKPLRRARSAARTRPGRLREWDETESFFTPTPVVLQGLFSIATLFALPPVDIVDVCAGAGPFGQAARRVWPTSRLLAVELRPSERAYLQRHYDQVHIGDATTMRLPQADLYTGNTAFSLTCCLAEAALEAVRPGGLVAFLTRQTLGDAETAEELLNRFPPLLELTISGRISMGSAGEASADQFGYQWFVWRGQRPRGSSWVRRLLPRLDAASLEWTARPGTGRLVEVDRDLVVDLAADPALAQHGLARRFTMVRGGAL